MKHIMLDLESLSTRSDAVIVAIAAVEFDFETAQTGRVFYVKIDIQSCLDAGLRVDGATLAWWFKQPDDTRLELLSNTIHLFQALGLLREFILNTNNGDVTIWANSPKFDLTKIENAYHAYQLPVPWVHTQEMCVRTFQSLVPQIKQAMQPTAAPHNALNDCLHQFNYCIEVYKHLGIIL